ncbi:MAG: hypothetical protein ABIQ89_04455 [Candidatus Saccharimonadales bacterium]
MLKKLLVLVTVVSVMLTFASSAKAAQVQQPKVTICHATNSVSNPYTKPEVNADSADGDTGNDNGKGDHSTHSGPVATTPQVAQALKNAKQSWGDIIPPHNNYAGLNWTAEGEAIYNNNCEYVEPDFDEPLITYEVTCPRVVGGKVVVALTNEGQADGTAGVNGDTVDVPAGTTVELEFDQGQKIQIVINDKVVFNETPVCGGKGADETTTPATPEVAQVVAPTAAVNAGNGAIAGLVSLVAVSLASVVAGVIRFRKVRI